jgi:hypothetical protein
MNTLMVFAGTVFLAYYVGRWVESLRWEEGYRQGKSVHSGGIDYRVMQERIYQHLLAERGPADDAGCCCEEKGVPYRSVNEG